MELNTQKLILAPPARVFEILTDLPNGATHCSAITRVEMLTPGEVAVGTRFRETRRLMGHEATEEMEVTVLEPPVAFELGCRSHGCRYWTRFRLAPEAEGTRVAATFGSEAEGLLARLLAPLTMKMGMQACAAALEQDLEDLKRVAEAAGSA